MKHILPFIGLLALIVADNSNSARAPDLVHKSGFENGLLRNQVIDILGQQRTYHLYLPGNPNAASIVLLLHGNGGGSANQILGLMGNKAPYKIWLDIAQRENLILVVPDGLLGANNQQGWNDCRVDAFTNPDADDVTFIDELIKFIQFRYRSIEPKFFAVGTSNGGLMAMRLAEAIPEKLHAVAFIVASKPVNSGCIASSVPLSVLIMNGTDDPILPYEGGQIGIRRGEVLSTTETVTYWTSRNQTDAMPIEYDIPNSNSNDGSTVKRYSYNNGNELNVVEHYEVIDGGHTEPSIAERYSDLFKLVVGSQNGDFEMAEEVWRFFQEKL